MQSNNNSWPQLTSFVPAMALFWLMFCCTVDSNFSRACASDSLLNLLFNFCCNSSSTCLGELSPLLLLLVLLTEADLLIWEHDSYVVDPLTLLLSIVADLKTFSAWLGLVFSALLSLSEEEPWPFVLVLMNAADDTQCGSEKGMTKGKSSPSGDNGVANSMGDDIVWNSISGSSLWKSPSLFASWC